MYVDRLLNEYCTHTVCKVNACVSNTNINSIHQTQLNYTECNSTDCTDSTFSFFHIHISYSPSTSSSHSIYFLRLPNSFLVLGLFLFFLCVDLEEAGCEFLLRSEVVRVLCGCESNCLLPCFDAYVTCNNLEWLS